MYGACVCIPPIHMLFFSHGQCFLLSPTVKKHMNSVDLKFQILVSLLLLQSLASALKLNPCRWTLAALPLSSKTESKTEDKFLLGGQ